MKRILFVVCLLMVGMLNAQSKKEQIEILTNRVDSLNRVLGSDRNYNTNKLNELYSTVKTLENQIEILTNRVDSLNLKLGSERITNNQKELAYKEQISSLQNQLENLNVSITKTKEELDKKNDTLRLLSNLKESENLKLSFSLDFIFSENIINQFKKIVLKYPSINSKDKTNTSNLLISKLFFEDKKLNALLIFKNRIYITEDDVKYPQEILNFFIVDCQNPNSMKVIYKWSSETIVCPVDLDNDILDIQFTDLNMDGNVEVWIVNEKYCLGGVDVSDLLVFMYENRNHCTLESMTNLIDIYDSETNSTLDDNYIRSILEKEPLIFDACFSNSGSIFLNYAKHLREKNIFGKSGFRFEKDGNDNPKFWNRN